MGIATAFSRLLLVIHTFKKSSLLDLLHFLFLLRLDHHKISIIKLFCWCTWEISRFWKRLLSDFAFQTQISHSEKNLNLIWDSSSVTTKQKEKIYSLTFSHFFLDSFPKSFAGTLLITKTIRILLSLLKIYTLFQISVDSHCFLRIYLQHSFDNFLERT